MSMNERATSPNPAPLRTERKEDGGRALTTPSFRRVYQELPGSPVVEIDVIEQLRANIFQLEDLQARMKFMLAEIKGLIQKS